MPVLTSDAPVTVSVVMSVCNGADRLRESVESVLSEEGVSFELIVVDDGSTDSTGAILADYAENDCRVRVLTQANQGLTRALISGCRDARGKYIARLDCGDISCPGRLAKQAAVLDAHPECAFVSCWTDFCGPDGEHLYTAKGSGAATGCPIDILSPDAEWGAIDGPTHHASVMFRADKYRESRGYREAFYFGQDGDLWYRLAERGGFFVIGETLCRARMSPDSISFTSKGLQHEFALQSLRAMRLRQEGLSDEPALETARAIALPALSARQRIRKRAEANYFVARLLTRNSDRRARQYLIRALKLEPLHLKSWLALLALPLSLARQTSSISSPSESS